MPNKDNERWIPFLCIFSVVEFFCIVVVVATPPKVVDSLFEVKQTNLLDLGIVTGVYTVNFDQPLMLPTTIPCGVTDCDAMSQQVASQDICPCDYTNLNGNCGTPLYPSMGCSCPDAAVLCNQTQWPWTDLNLGQLTYQYVPAGGYAHFRLLLNESCGSLGVRVFTVRGGPYLYINTNTTRFLEDPQLNPIGKSTGSQRALFYNLCPGEPGAIVGTYFLSILGIDDTEVGILAVSKPVLDITETPSTAACTAPGNYTCLQDTVAEISQCVEQNLHLSYGFEVVGCQKLSFKLDCYNEDDFDIYLSFNNSYPYYGTSRYASYENGDEQLFISVCAPGGGSATLFITMDCYHLSEGSPGDFSLVVTSQSNWSYIPINSLPAYGAPWHLVGTSRVIIDRFGDANDDLNWLNCEHWRYGCEYVWHVYPGPDANTWWPLPPAMKSFSQFTGVSIDVENVTVNTANNFKMLLLMSVEQDGAVTEILSIDQIASTGIEFLDIITNSQGEAVTGVYPITRKSTQCDFYAWNQTNAQVQEVVTEIGETYDPDKLLSLQYLLGTIQYLDSWYYCKKYVNSFLDISSNSISLNSSGCSSQFKTEEWQEDPCCWPLRRWNYTCYPHNVNANNDVYSSINSNHLDQYCANPKCTESFLEDYKTFLNDYSNTNSSSGCSAPKESYLDAYNAKLLVYRACKDQVWDEETTYCVQDSDCGGYLCDLVHRACLVPLDTQERNFLQCLVDNMDIYQENFIKNQFGLNGTRYDTSFFEGYLAGLRNTSHCVPFSGLDVTARDHYYLHVLDAGCARTGNCPFVTCEDSSCTLEENACLTWCEFGQWDPVTVDQMQCEQNVYCNWDFQLCENLTPSECQTDCLASPGYFCGWCENNETCTEIPGITSESECLSSTVCILPNGTYAVNASSAECQSIGSCTEFCAPKCKSETYPGGACYTTSLDLATCVGVGGSYNALTEACVLGNVTKSQDCPSGFSWESCSGLNLYECGQCYQDADDSLCPVNQDVMKCLLDFKTQCQNSTECSTAGYCSSRENLLSIDSSTVPPTLEIFGACIVPKTEPLLESNYANVLLLPFCTLPLESFPNGCIDYSMNYTECITSNFTWWFPSFSQANCLQVEGCYDIYNEYFVPDLMFVFSPKSRTDCESPYNNGGTWKSYFNWKSAKWIPGTMRNLTWAQKEVKSAYQYQPAVDFDLAMNSFLQGSIVEGALAVKSSILCANSRTEQTLYTVSCDCTDSSQDSAQCFSGSVSSPVGEGLPCPGIETELITPTSTIFFANDSVSNTCVDVLVSEISRTQYQKQPKPKLSANFATFKAKEEFAVKNSKDAVIGILLGDGVEITATREVTNATLCLQFETSSSKDFTVWDFGYTDPKYKKITPLELSGVEPNDDMLCAVVSFDTTTRSFFPIVRKDGWSSAEPETYDSTTTGLIYTLAVLFLLVSVAAFGKLVYETFFIAKSQAKFDVKYFAVLFTFMFNFLRSVYFFIAPTGLDNAAADFLMVVLPTFFYFTAFTLIIVVWAVMCLSSISSNTKKYMRMSYYGAAIINGILYVFFILVVVIFQYGSTDNPTQCGGRVDEDSSREDFQQRIAIAYATVIAVVSLAIGVSYMYFGGKLYWQLRKSGSGRKQSQRKIFLLTLVSSVGFILHCIFLVILTALSKPSVIFSFLGLIITEIIPSCYLLVAFNKFKKQVTTKSTGNTVGMTESPGSN